MSCHDGMYDLISFRQNYTIIPCTSSQPPAHSQSVIMSVNQRKQLLDLVEANMKSCLGLESTARRQQLASRTMISSSSANKPLPFTILSTEGNSPATHLFEIPPPPQEEDSGDNNIFGGSQTSAETERSKFGVVTMNGCITVYDTMFRRIIWKWQTKLEKVSWGILSSLAQEGSSSSSRSRSDPTIIMMQSRQSGFHLVKPVVVQKNEDDDVPLEDDHSSNSNNKQRLISSETHIGFCKPLLCSDHQHVVVPIGNDRIGIHNMKHHQKSLLRPCYKFEAGVKAVKEVSHDEVGGSSSNSSSSKLLLLCTTEEGLVHLLEIKWSSGGGGAKEEEEEEEKETPYFVASLLSKLLLPNCEDVEERPSGTCIEGDKNVFAIGTHSKYMFLIKVVWDPAEEGNNSSLQLEAVGKKILPTAGGVSCMALGGGAEEGNGQGLLAVGCDDGTIRLFGFPEMNQISAINYHSSPISSLLFINEKVVVGKTDGNKKGDAGRCYLCCGASNTASGLSVWKIPAKK